MTRCGNCNQPIVDSICGCPTNSAPKQITVCNYQTEIGLDPNATYSVALKKVTGGKECCSVTACSGATMPLENFIEGAVFGLFAPYLTVNEVGHGFVITDHPLPVYQDQANPGVWLLAQDGVNQAEAIIVEIIDENNFRVAATPGFYKVDHGLDPANKYYLSAATPGAVTTTPTTQILFNPLTTNVIQYL